MNTIKTGLLLTGLTLLLIYGGAALGGQTGMTFALVFAVLMNFGSFFWSDKIALKMSGARPVSPDQAPRLYRITQSLVERAGLPLPRLYLIPQPSPNAFATGRNPQNSAVAVTAGLLELLNDDELEGVIAHELAHIRNRDTLIMTVAATLAGAVTYVAHMAQWALLFGGYGGRDNDRGGNPFAALLMIIVAPIAALLIQMAISRRREYAADATAARIVGHPMGLANALRKLGEFSRRIPMRNVAPATAHLYIAQPLLGGLGSLFSTHPPMEDRIRRLLSV